MKDKTKLLKCKCGDCSHWEIIQLVPAHSTSIKCVTCGVEYNAIVKVDPHVNLHFVEHKA